MARGCGLDPDDLQYSSGALLSVSAAAQALGAASSTS
jgi:hypothetical protein